jgi:predicted TIM-barrel fold metal-dependent hydrolase
MTALLYSADDHVWEPADLWQTQLPKALRERALHYRFVDGFFVYVLDGEQIVCGELFRRPDGSPIEPDVNSRVRDMDADGVWAQVLYPNIGMQIFQAEPDLAMPHARVYNDFIAEAFGPRPDRFVPIACVPVFDVSEAVEEVQRIATLGVRGIMLPLLPPFPYHHDRYEPLWSAAEETNTVVSFHIATGFAADENGRRQESFRIFDQLVNAPVGRTERELEATRTVGAIDIALAVQRDIAAVIGAGVLERHPTLHVVSAENNAHWLPSMAGAMDKAWTLGIGQGPADLRAGIYDFSRSPSDQPNLVMPFAMNERWPYPLRPSDYVRRQVHATFMDDPVAIATRDFLGVQTLMWSSDYPHPEGTWPRSREAVDAMFAGVPDHDRAAMTGRTMAALYGLPVPVE